ncbi:MAG: CRISPR-associated endonuclease Cas3'', partial [Pseudomonadota bacterium]
MIWAKTFKDGRAKSLRDHGLDVAAVAHVWQALHQDRVAREADTLGVDPAALAGIRTFFASLHDLGKCSRAFQQKVPALWPEEFGGLREFADKAHWRLSARLLNEPQIKTDLLQGLPGLHVDDFRAIVAAIAGHHGEPPEDTDFDKVKLTGKTAPIGAAALEAARGLVEVFRTVLNPPPLSGLNNARASALSWQLSGLITLADWVGSDADHFGPVDSGLLAGDYFELAKEQAYKALAAKGLIAQGPTEAPGLAAVSPNAAAHPRPMQSHADTLKLPEGPCLIMIEDTTGSGKTEAALALAARMMAAGKGEGVYFAL